MIAVPSAKTAAARSRKRASDEQSELSHLTGFSQAAAANLPGG